MENAGASNITVGTASTVVFPRRNNGRLAFSISNYSALTVFVNLSDNQGAAIGSGIALYPGMTISDSINGDVPCWQGTITAIEATGAATLALWERVLA